MGRTIFDQDTQMFASLTYDDTIAPSEANHETNPTNLEQNLNSFRSMLSLLKDVQAGDWFDDLVVPSGLSGDTPTKRGVDDRFAGGACRTHEDT